MKVLLHMCCMPCSLMCIETLEKEGHDITGFSYNPNIHPKIEYLNRKETVRYYMEKVNKPVLFFDEYDMVGHIKNTTDDIENRCLYCYSVRLRAAADYAKKNGFDAFTTSLLISIYQKHDKIKEIAEKISKEYDIPFLYRDFRPYFREGQNKARELGLYMQKYCGCIYSIDSGKQGKVVNYGESI